MKEKLQTTPCLSTRRMYKGVCIFFLMISGVAQSQPTMLGQITNESKNFVTINGRLYFSVYDSLMTATSSTAPALVAKTNEPILNIYNITVGTDFFFVTQTGSGQRLWRSDGTSAVQVFAETQITPLLAYHSQLFMHVNSTTTGVELWKMDGAYNVSLLKDINPGPANGFMGSLIIHSDLLYFFANAGTETALWRSDGTTAGTLLSVDLDNTDDYSAMELSELTSVNNLMFYTRNYLDPGTDARVAELWKSNGSEAGTSVLVSYVDDDNYPNDMSHFLAFKGKLYFFHTQDIYSYLSVSDGTVSGTKHLELVTIDGRPRKIIEAESYFLFYADGQGLTTPLKKSDGTTTTTVHDWSMYHSPSETGISLTYTEGRAFFTDNELYQADLATGITRPVHEIYNIPSFVGHNIVAADGSIFFTRTTSTNQMSLWYYDPSTSPVSCGGTGNILQEIWTNVTGTDVQAFDFSTPPNGEPRSFTSFETTQYYANNYASRMRGLICVPQSGQYTFWISSDDQSELYLSTDSNEENKRKIAWVYGHTRFLDYDKYSTQKSALIYLEANRKYYIEVRHKEGNGNDFISVGWQLPDSTMQRPIPGDRLSAITSPPNQPPVIVITSPQPDQTFPSASTVTISADVTDPDGVVSQVVFRRIFSNGSSPLVSLMSPPYEYEWNDVPPGTHEVRVTAWDNKGAESNETVFFTVEPCAGTGTIVREIWTGISGTSVSSIPVNSPPNTTVELTSLATTNYYGNDYGSRIRGYVCVPATGAYTFWIAGDDNSELWLSNNDDPEGKARVAYVSGHTRVNEWTKYSIQQSGLINLVQGQRYYIEVLHKEANGADHVEVGWQLPSGTLERPITGDRLIPFEDPTTSAARFATGDVFSFENQNTVTISPNPVTSGQQVSISLPGAGDAEVYVDIKSITGVSVQHEMLSSNDGAVVIDLNPAMAAGMYLVRVSNDKQRWSAKLQVK